MNFALLRGAEQSVVTRVETSHLGGLFGLGAVAEGNLLVFAAGGAVDPATCRHAGILLLAPPLDGRCFLGHGCLLVGVVLRAVSEFPPPLQNVL
jgi:hypothetical protein